MQKLTKSSELNSSKKNMQIWYGTTQLPIKIRIQHFNKIQQGQEYRLDKSSAQCQKSQKINLNKTITYVSNDFNSILRWSMGNRSRTGHGLIVLTQ